MSAMAVNQVNKNTSVKIVKSLLREMGFDYGETNESVANTDRRDRISLLPFLKIPEICARGHLVQLYREDVLPITCRVEYIGINDVICLILVSGGFGLGNRSDCFKVLYSVNSAEEVELLFGVVSKSSLEDHGHELVGITEAAEGLPRLVEWPINSNDISFLAGMVYRELLELADEAAANQVVDDRLKDTGYITRA